MLFVTNVPKGTSPNEPRLISVSNAKITVAALYIEIIVCFFIIFTITTDCCIL